MSEVGVVLVLGDSAGTSGVFQTVTVQVVLGFLVPSLTFAVIVASPGPTAITLPFASTVATLLSDVVQVIFL